VEVLRRFGMEREEAAAVRMLRFILRAHQLALDADARALGELSRGFDEAEVFILHHKPDGAATRATAKAFICAALGIDRERRRALVVKRAERFPDAARALHRPDVARDDIEDVVCGIDLVENLFGDLGHSGESNPAAAHGCREAVLC